MDVNDAKKLKDIKDARDDLDIIDDILGNVDKFRLQSNKVYDDITHKARYAPYIAAARVKYQLPYGNIAFKAITNYMARRKIISALREALIAYIEVEVIKK